MYSDYVTVAGSKVPVVIVGKQEIPNTNGDGVTVFKMWAQGHIRMFEHHEHIQGKTGPETVYYCRVACYNASRAARQAVVVTLAPQKGKVIPFEAAPAAAYAKGHAMPFEQKVAI